MNPDPSSTSGKSAWIDAFQSDPTLMRTPWHESPFFETLIDRLDAPEELKTLAKDFHRDGYIVLDPGIEDFDAKADRIIRDLTPHYPTDKNRRIQEGWYFHEDVRALACTPKILTLLGALYGRAAIPFQTLNFDRGTQQSTHSDTIHFHSAPARFMAGVWIALEDIDADNGPLHYYPGSHRLPTFSFEDLELRDDLDPYRQYEMFVESLMHAHGLERRELHVPKGQALIWSANLFHGGSAVRDPARTRHSQVTHYYFENCLYYMPLSSNPLAGELCLREVIDITTAKFVSSTYGKKQWNLENHSPVYRYPRPLPSFVQAPIAD